MPELENLQKRIEKLEKDNTRRMLAQYLLYPLILAVIGYFLNRTIERQKLEVQKIQITQTLIPNLFSENHSQSLATELIVTKVEPELAAELHQITADYYKQKLKSDISKGQYESAENIISAAKSIGGPVGDQIVKSAESVPATVAAINKLDVARGKEREGFQALLDGDFAQAQKAFQDSENAYNSYHQVYEIARFLKLHMRDFNKPESKKEMLRTIVEQFYRGAPPDLLDKLKAVTNTQAGG